MLPFMIALLALVGLRGPDRPAEAPPRQDPEPVVAPSPLLVRVDLPDVAPSGMGIPFRVVLANGGDSAIQVELSGRPIAFDLVVRRAERDVVWRRLEGVPVEAIFVIRTLAPGEVLTFEDRWDQRDSGGRLVAPGSYQVRAVLPVADVPGGWGSEPRELTIIP